MMQKIRNLVVQAPAVNFETDNTLAVWAKHVDRWIFDSPAIPGKLYEEYITGMR